MSEIDKRNVYSRTKIDAIKAKLQQSATLVSEKACVYATGSYGRSEAGQNSDLDLFIISKAKKKPKEEPDDRAFKNQLSNLDAICVKAELIRTIKGLGIKQFDGDGKYLDEYNADMLIKYIGDPEDDSENTFTARLLLLLESTPILEINVYNEVIQDVIAEYWKDYPKHSQSFVPAYLANDILRLWRTFCVNYEARTKKTPEEKRIKRKIKNYTLKYSRVITCYSALLYLLNTYKTKGTVHVEDAKEMVSLRPIDRLRRLESDPALNASKPRLQNVINMYNEYLESKRDEGLLFSAFSDSARAHAYIESGNRFCEAMFRALNEIGTDSRLHQILLI